jgi:hypothetical protein
VVRGVVTVRTAVAALAYVVFYNAVANIDRFGPRTPEIVAAVAVTLPGQPASPPLTSGHLVGLEDPDTSGNDRGSASQSSLGHPEQETPEFVREALESIIAGGR